MFPAFVDYGATSTIVGWSSYTVRSIRYHVLGDIVFVSFFINGASNAGTASFTLPFTAVNNNVNFMFPTYNLDNNVNPGVPGLGSLFANANTVNLYTNYGGSGWTASGTKRVQGEFFYVKV